jgi:hypothetical protein
MPASQETQPETAAQRFARLARRWQDETWMLSSTTQRVLHPAYQQIIGMGRDAIPHLLHGLDQRDPEHWFWALAAITGEDPVPPEDRGNVRRMADAWLGWARRQGYLS